MASKKAFLGVGGKPRFPQPDQQKHIDSVSKNIAILTGQTKNTKDRAVLFRDLQDFGLVDKRGKFVGFSSGDNGGSDSGNDGGSPVNPRAEIPHKPENVRAVPGFTTVMIKWDFPSYAGHDYAEIYRNTIDALGDMTDPRTEGEAVKIATSSDSMYLDSVEHDTEYYYWVRFVNTNGSVGPVQSASGVYAKTRKDPLQEIADFQEESLATLNTFQTSFNEQIGRIDTQIAEFGFDATKATIEELGTDVTTLQDGLYNQIITSQNNYDEWLDSAGQLLGRVNATDANINENYYTSEEADTAIASKITEFESLVIREEFATRAQIEESYYTKTDADDATAAQITAFRTDYVDVNFVTGATLTQNYYTKTSAESAITAQINNLKTVYLAENYKTSAEINQAHYTKTDADDAISAALTTYEAETLAGKYETKAYISNNIYTKTSADTAMSAKVDEFKAELIDDEGNLTTAFANQVTEVLTDEGGALSGAIANYGVEYNGTTYTIAEGIQASVDLDGVYQTQWGVQTQVGDLQHGVGFIDDNGTTTFMVSADSFAVFNPVDGQWEAIFGVTDGKVIIKEAVMGDAVINTLSVAFSATFENEVFVNGTLDAWKLKGAQITGNALWMVNGNHSLAIEPDDFLAFWYGEAVYYNVETDTDDRSIGNAKFALTNNGRVIARGLELYDNNNTLIMSANGMSGTFIRNLTVDTLKIKADAVTVPTYIEGEVVFTDHVWAELLDYSFEEDFPIKAMFNFSVLFYRQGDISGADAVSITMLVYEDGQQIDSIALPNMYAESVGGKNFGHSLPLFGAVSAPSGKIRVRVSAQARVENQMYSFKLQGSITNAKR